MVLTERKLKGGKSGGEMYRVETNSFVRVKPIIEYLNNHRLKTKKQISPLPHNPESGLCGRGVVFNVKLGTLRQSFAIKGL